MQVSIGWTKTYGGGQFEDASCVRQTSDGGYILAGCTESLGAGETDVYLVKTDGQGKVTWSKTYGGAGWDIGYSVQQTHDAGYIVVGSTRQLPSGGDNVYLLKTDAQGNFSWSQTHGRGGVDIGWCVQGTSDGGYIVAGETSNPNDGAFDLYLIKTDAHGATAQDNP